MEPFLTSLEKSKRGYQMSDFDLNNEQYDKSTVEGNLHLILTARGFMDTVREGSCSIDHLKAFTDMIVLGPESERVRKLLRRWIPELRLRRSDHFTHVENNWRHRYFVDRVRLDTDEETAEEDIAELAEAERHIWEGVLLAMTSAMIVTFDEKLTRERQEAEEAWEAEEAEQSEPSIDDTIKGDATQDE